MNIVIDIGGTTMRVAKTDGRKLLNVHKAPTPKDFSEAMSVLKELLLQVKEDDSIASVCLGMPGFVNEHGLIERSGMLKEWKGSNIFEAIKQYLDIKIVFVNDAALAALGEAFFGAGKDYEKVGYITISTGLGGAKVVSKVLSREEEPGQLVLEDNTKAESMLSGTAVIKQTGKNPHDITDQGFWDTYHTKLIKYLHILQEAWRVDTFILGGGMVNHNHINFETLNKSSLPLVQRLQLGDEVGLYGGIAFLSSTTFLQLQESGGKFFWGAATAAHQVEGGTHNNWSVWEESMERLGQLKRENKNPKSHISAKAADHYHLYEKDFELAQSLSHNAYRFSIEWSRLEPEEGKWNEQEFQHYIDMIASMKRHGLEPFMTLWHWTMPLWVSERGGASWRGFPKAFAQFAGKCAEVFGPHLSYIITLNEPEVHAAATYIHGVHPPAKKSILNYLKAYRNLTKSHNLSFHAIKLVNQSLNVGFASHQILFQAKNNSLVNKMLAAAGNFWWNDMLLGSMHKHLDFIGVNFYFRKELDFGGTFHQSHASCVLSEIEAREKQMLEKNPRISDAYPNLNKIENAVPYSDMGWELYPHGLGEAVTRVYKKYNLPVIVTENGLADLRDKYRAWYITEAVNSLMKAKKEGTNTFGYLHWSLLDNFEWQDGFGPRFGLVEIDYNNLQRKVRSSAYIYKKIIDKDLTVLK